MKCPVCKLPSLQPFDLEENLPALVCSECAGYWVDGTKYWTWLEHRAAAAAGKPPAEGSSLEVKDSGPAKLCPACGRFLIRHKVGHGTTFHVDRCGVCGGMWFDANEWEILRSRNMHGQIHLVFSEPWRAAVARQERQLAHEQFVREKLGSADFAEIKRVKQWLDQHPRRSELYAFLMHEGE